MSMTNVDLASWNASDGVNSTRGWIKTFRRSRNRHSRYVLRTETNGRRLDLSRLPKLIPPTPRLLSSMLGIGFLFYVNPFLPARRFMLKANRFLASGHDAATCRAVSVQGVESHILSWKHVTTKLSFSQSETLCVRPFSTVIFNLNSQRLGRLGMCNYCAKNADAVTGP